MSELRPPFADDDDQTSVYGPTFAACLMVGGGFIAFGVWSLLAKASSTKPTNFAVFFVGLALVHDFLVAPAALAVATGTRKVTPRVARGLLHGVLMVSAVLTLFAIPALFGWGSQPDNPSFLPRDYAMGLLVVLAVAWGSAAAMLGWRVRRARAAQG